MKIIKTKDRKAEEILRILEQRGAVKTAEVEPTVRKIMADVRKGGDKSLRKLAEKFDSLQAKESIRVTPGEMLDAWIATPEALKQAMTFAAKNIRSFAEQQKPDECTS